MENKLLIKTFFFFCGIAEFDFYMMFQNDTFVAGQGNTTRIKHLRTRTEHLRTPVNLVWPTQANNKLPHVSLNIIQLEMVNCYEICCVVTSTVENINH